MSIGGTARGTPVLVARTSSIASRGARAPNAPNKIKMVGVEKERIGKKVQVLQPIIHAGKDRQVLLVPLALQGLKGPRASLAYQVFQAPTPWGPLDHQVLQGRPAPQGHRVPRGPKVRQVRNDRAAPSSPSLLHPLTPQTQHPPLTEVGEMTRFGRETFSQLWFICRGKRPQYR